jgi:protein gp37
MSKSPIEWTDDTINPLPFICHRKCKYCYAHRKGFYNRLRWDKEHKLSLKCFNNLPKKAHKKVFVCSLHDVLGEWVPDESILRIIDECRKRPHLTFQFLSKNPGRYTCFTFPENCWLGATIDSGDSFNTSNWFQFSKFIYANANKNIHFISFEPLLEPYIDEIHLEMMMEMIDWVIIGKATGCKEIEEPEYGYISEITLLASQNDVAIFEKDNLKEIIKDTLRQEFPNES